LKVVEIKAKSILNKSSIGDYCINVYVGCQHACKYCYASYYTERIYEIKEPWGSFVLIKVNAPQLLVKEIVKKKKGVVYLSSLSDPYQPIEAKYKLTRKILEVLLRYKWPVIIQTKSTLLLRDLDLLKRFDEIEVGFTLITLDEKKRKEFEPGASPVEARIEALKRLKKEGIKTFAFLGPIIPFTEFSEVEKLIEKLSFVDKIYIDKLRYKPGLENRLPLQWFNANNYYMKLKKKFKNKATFVY